MNTCKLKMEEEQIIMLRVRMKEKRRQSLIKQSSKNLTRCVKTGGECGIVYTDAVINQHGFMTSTRNRKRHAVYTEPI